MAFSGFPSASVEALSQEPLAPERESVVRVILVEREYRLVFSVVVLLVEVVRVVVVLVVDRQVVVVLVAWR